MKALADPLSTPVRLRAAGRRAVSRIRATLGTIAGRPRGMPQPRHPFLDYRRELSAAPAGRALLSYLVEPFHRPPEDAGKQDYSNWTMSLEIANALNRIGLAVDVINYDDYTFVPARPYDVFVGMAANFSRLLPLIPEHTRTVYWATRPDPAFEMEAIRQRQLALYQRRQQWVPTTDALLPLLESADYHQADGLMLIGNESIRATFRTPSTAVYCIDNPALQASARGTAARDFSQARRNFLFLSSWLLVRKGLDLVLEAFAARPHLDLWICGPVDSEPEFLKAYRTELFHTPNIHSLGWVAMQSDALAEVTHRCAFLVFPSCAEGMSGSVINGMARGLVPICTPATGVDLDDFGLPLLDATPEALMRILDGAAAMPDDEWQRRSIAAQHTARERYSVSNFRAQIEGALRGCLASPRNAAVWPAQA